MPVAGYLLDDADAGGLSLSCVLDSMVVFVILSFVFGFTCCEAIRFRSRSLYAATMILSNDDEISQASKML